MGEDVYLDVTIVRCPRCGKLYADASWYVIDMESELGCSVCGKSFSTRNNVVERVLIKFSVVDDVVRSVEISKRLPPK